MNTTQQLFDVIAVDLKTREERRIATEKTERNAEAIIAMAVIRHGFDDEYFKSVPAGTPLSKAPQPTDDR